MRSERESRKEEGLPVDLEERVEIARAQGEEAGRAAGTWLLDGNSSEESARAMLAKIEAGELLAELDLSGPLSGEWADGPTPASILEPLYREGEEIPEGEDDEICQAYEDAYWQGLETEAERSARAVLGGEPDPAPESKDLEEQEEDSWAEARSELAQNAVEALEELRDLLELAADGEPRYRWPHLLPEIQGEGYGWLGGPFVIDELRAMAAELEEERGALDMRELEDPEGSFEPVQQEPEEEAAEAELRAKIRAEVEEEAHQDAMEWIEGDAENGPRSGYQPPSEEELEAEVDRRLRGECSICGGLGGSHSSGCPDSYAEAGALEDLEPEQAEPATEEDCYWHMRQSEPRGHGWGAAGSPVGPDHYRSAHARDHERGAGHAHAAGAAEQG
jgi:hypothetical protein